MIVELILQIAIALNTLYIHTLYILYIYIYIYIYAILLVSDFPKNRTCF